MGPAGRPVLGAVAGFVFFFFIGLTLMVVGVIPLSGPWLVLPFIGIVVGALWGWWAPFGRKRSQPVTLVPGAPVAGHVPTTSAPAWTVRPVTGELPIVPPVTEKVSPTTGQMPPVEQPTTVVERQPAGTDEDPLHWAAPPANGQDAEHPQT